MYMGESFKKVNNYSGAAGMLRWILGVVLVGVVSLTPLVFFPGFVDVYGFPKVLWLAIGTTVALVLWVAGQAVENELRVVRTPLNLPVALMMVAVLASILVQSPNVAEAFMGKGGLILALGVLFYIIVAQPVRLRRQILGGLIVTTLVLALVAIWQFSGAAQTLAFLPDFLRSRGWNPMGAPFALLVFLVVMLVTILGVARRAGETVRVGMYLGAAVILVAIILEGWLVLPGKEFAPRLLAPGAGYSIAVDTLKGVRSAVLGVGPENYLFAFGRFRPVSINQTDNWGIRFNNSSSELFGWVTTMGLAELFGVGFLVLRLWRTPAPDGAGQEGGQTASGIEKGLVPGLAAVGVAFLAVPFSYLMWFAGFILVALWAGEAGEIKRWQYKEPVLGVVLMVAPVGFLAASLYFGGRAAQGEVAFAKSLRTLAANQGVETYNLQIAAIGANPYKTNYRVAYSQTNLALAAALASQQQVTDEDKQKITVLVQQAIREAKTAVALNQQNVTVWENLAAIYRQLVNLAGGADQFALQSYQQALALDPRNPRLWLEYGGMWYGLGDFDEAETAFRQAVALKGDFANGRYNLAKTYEKQEKYQKAAREMALVISLVEPGSADAQKAQAELAALNEKLPRAEEEQPQAGEETKELIEPVPLPTPGFSGFGEIELPQGAAPEVTITPIPLVSPTPQVNL